MQKIRDRITAHRERSGRATARNPELRKLPHLVQIWSVIGAARQRRPAHLLLVPRIERLIGHAIDREARIRHERGKAEAARHRIEHDLRFRDFRRRDLRHIERHDRPALILAACRNVGVLHDKQRLRAEMRAIVAAPSVAILAPAERRGNGRPAARFLHELPVRRLLPERRIARADMQALALRDALRFAILHPADFHFALKDAHLRIARRRSRHAELRPEIDHLDIRRIHRETVRRLRHLRRERALDQPAMHRRENLQRRRRLHRHGRAILELQRRDAFHEHEPARAEFRVHRCRQIRARPFAILRLHERRHRAVKKRAFPAQKNRREQSHTRRDRRSPGRDRPATHDLFLRSRSFLEKPRQRLPLRAQRRMQPHLLRISRAQIRIGDHVALEGVHLRLGEQTLDRALDAILVGSGVLHVVCGCAIWRLTQSLSTPRIRLSRR